MILRDLIYKKVIVHKIYQNFTNVNIDTIKYVNNDNEPIGTFFITENIVSTQ